MVADFSQTTIKNLLSRGVVSQDDFMEKIENSAEVKDKLKDYVKSGYIENKEQLEMSKILEKIYAELAAGITVTNTK